MPENVFVLGLDDLNLRMLQELPHLARYRFHRLLSIEELQLGDLDFDRLVAKAEAELDAFAGPVDAIIGFWDFPVTTMVPVLCARYGLRGPSLEAIVKCEHKYWSRVEQATVIDEVPAFGLVDLEDGAPRPPPGVRCPMWLKPVKSTSAALAFLVRDAAEFSSAVAEIRAGIDVIGRPFESVLARLDLPPGIEAAGGMACLAEEPAGGAQVTVEGCVFGGEVHVYGVVDSIDLPDRPSFLRYRRPARPVRRGDRRGRARTARHDRADHRGRRRPAVRTALPGQLQLPARPHLHGRRRRSGAESPVRAVSGMAAVRGRGGRGVRGRLGEPLEHSGGGARCAR